MILHVMNICYMSQSHNTNKVIENSKIIMLYNIVIIYKIDRYIVLETLISSLMLFNTKVYLLS